MAQGGRGPAGGPAPAHARAACAIPCAPGGAGGRRRSAAAV